MHDRGTSPLVRRSYILGGHVSVLWGRIVIYSSSFSLSVTRSMISCKPILPFTQSNSAHNNLYIGLTLHISARCLFPSFLNMPSTSLPYNICTWHSVFLKCSSSRCHLNHLLFQQALPDTHWNEQFLPWISWSPLRSRHQVILDM